MSNQEKENYLRDLELLCSRIKKQKHDDDIRETIKRIGEENMRSFNNFNKDVGVGHGQYANRLN